MTSTTFFFIFIPILAVVLLAINLIFAPHNPYQEKDSAFECGFHSFLGQNRTQFSISFFIFALLFLLFDLEILLVYPYVVSAYSNDIYGLVIMLIFFLALTLGFAFELGKNALKIDSRQTLTLLNKRNSSTTVISSILPNIFWRIKRLFYFWVFGVSFFNTIVFVYVSLFGPLSQDTLDLMHLVFTTFIGLTLIQDVYALILPAISALSAFKASLQKYQHTNTLRNSLNGTSGQPQSNTDQRMVRGGGRGRGTGTARDVAPNVNLSQASGSGANRASRPREDLLRITLDPSRVNRASDFVPATRVNRVLLPRRDTPIAQPILNRTPDSLTPFAQPILGRAPDSLEYAADYLEGRQQFPNEFEMGHRIPGVPMARLPSPTALLRESPVSRVYEAGPRNTLGFATGDPFYSHYEVYPEGHPLSREPFLRPLERGPVSETLAYAGSRVVTAVANEAPISRVNEGLAYAGSRIIASVENEAPVARVTEGLADAGSIVVTAVANEAPISRVQRAAALRREQGLTLVDRLVTPDVPVDTTGRFTLSNVFAEGQPLHPFFLQCEGLGKRWADGVKHAFIDNMLPPVKGWPAGSIPNEILPLREENLHGSFTLSADTDGIRSTPKYPDVPADKLERDRWISEKTGKPDYLGYSLAKHMKHFLVDTADKLELYNIWFKAETSSLTTHFRSPDTSAENVNATNGKVTDIFTEIRQHANKCRLALDNAENIPEAMIIGYRTMPSTQIEPEGMIQLKVALRAAIVTCEKSMEDIKEGNDYQVLRVRIIQDNEKLIKALDNYHGAPTNVRGEDLDPYTQGSAWRS